MKSFGIKYPMTINSIGNLQLMSTEKQRTYQNIFMYLNTEKGSRIMRPDLGIPLYRYLGEPLKQEILEQIEDNIRENMQNAFQEVNITNVQITQPDELTFKLQVDFRFVNDLEFNEPDSIEVTIQ